MYTDRFNAILQVANYQTILVVSLFTMFFFFYLFSTKYYSTTVLMFFSFYYSSIIDLYGKIILFERQTSACTDEIFEYKPSESIYLKNKLNLLKF